MIITDGLRVDGHVQGDIRVRQDARGLLVLSEKGSIQGSVKVYDAVINGTVTGDLEVEHFLDAPMRANTEWGLQKAGGAITWRCPEQVPDSCFLPYRRMPGSGIPIALSGWPPPGLHPVAAGPAGSTVQGGQSGFPG